MSPEILVVCAVIEREGKVLLGRRASGRSLAGKWELPGGKCEPGESAPQALKRELREELGWETSPQYSIGKVVTTDQGRSLSLEAWYTLAPSTPPRAHVHDAFVWVDVKLLLQNSETNLSPGQLTLDELAPADVPLLRAWLGS